MGKLESEGTTIANGASQSSVIDLRSRRLKAIVMPSSWTAADFTFLASADNVTYQAVYDDNATELTVKAAASRVLTLRDDISSCLEGVGYVKLRSGTSAVPVNQGAARTVFLLTEPRS